MKKITPIVLLLATLTLFAQLTTAQHRIGLSRESAEAVYRTGDDSLLVQGREVDVWTRSETPTGEELHLALRLALGIVPRCLDVHKNSRDDLERWILRPPSACKRVSE